MNRGEQRGTDAVHLSRAGMDGIELKNGKLRLGATSTYTQVLGSDVARDAVPILRTVSNGITGGRQLRNQATVGGAASYANPASDMPAVLAVLQAEFVVANTDGYRSIPASDYFQGPFRTALRPRDLLVGMDLPTHDLAHGYVKFKLSESSWPIVTGAARIWRDTSGRVRAHLALGAVAPTPVVVDLTEFVNQSAVQLVPPAKEELADLIDTRLGDTWTDELAPGDYRRAIAATIGIRTLNKLNKEAS